MGQIQFLLHQRHPIFNPDGDDRVVEIEMQRVDRVRRAVSPNKCSAGQWLGIMEEAHNQGLRTTVIAGRVDLGMPDWRGLVPGRPMSSQEIADVVAWLISHRKN